MWSATSKPKWDQSETSLRRRMPGGALAINFGRWIWGDQILLPKTMNVIAAVVTKHNYTSCILWHAYQLATSQVKSQLKTIRKQQHWTSTLNLQHWILREYIENLFPVNLPFLVCLLIVIQICFLNYRHQEISNQTFKENLFASSFLKPLTLKKQDFRNNDCYWIIVFSNKNYLKFFTIIYVSHLSWSLSILVLF